MSSNKLKLDFINVTLEPYSSLSLDKQIISRASHVGNGKSILEEVLVRVMVVMEVQA